MADITEKLDGVISILETAITEAKAQYMKKHARGKLPKKDKAGKQLKVRTVIGNSPEKKPGHFVFVKGRGQIFVPHKPEDSATIAKWKAKRKSKSEKNRQKAKKTKVRQRRQ